MSEELKKLFQDKNIKSIVKILFKEKESGKIGISISQLSRKTHVERHKLSGILEVLSVLGVIIIFQIGMIKMVSIKPEIAKLLQKILVKK